MGIKGHTNNPNGKPKGTKNKITYKTRELIAAFVEENFDDVMKTLNILDPKDRVAAFINLMKFVVPPARDVEADQDAKSAMSDFISRLFQHDKEE